MKLRSFFLVAVLALAAWTTPAPAATVSVGFSPGNAESLVVQTIDNARQSVLVAAYSFTSRPIATALIAAKNRGVIVMVVVDKSQQTARYTSAAYLSNQGVPVRTDSHYAIMHNKFMVVDSRTVETGSFNFTRAATFENAENVVVLGDDPAVAAVYGNEWRRLWNESTDYVRSAPGSGSGSRRRSRQRGSPWSWVN
jgi:phosphatidylserine/phosphatidylglycerophosphate/cardiolipin synthase-like enzyme